MTTACAKGTSQQHLQPTALALQGFAVRDRAEAASCAGWIGARPGRASYHSTWASGEIAHGYAFTFQMWAAYEYD